MQTIQSEYLKPIFALLFLLGGSNPASASPDSPPSPDGRDAEIVKIHEEIDRLRESLDRLEAGSAGEESSSVESPFLEVADRFTFGGYGEIHVNLGEGSEPDIIDIHRLVAFVGYDFADWIKLSSETELEHSAVSDETEGELVIEQLYVDFLLSDAINVRFGRVLTPLGIVNQKHEPPTFNGVERPSFSHDIIPTTWSSDGIGIFGDVTDWVDYQLYVVGGLDGTGFDATEGIRGGRINERPSLHEPAITGRLDAHPLLHTDLVPDQDLRLGVSFYTGGLDNGNEGADTGLDASIAIYSADCEYTFHRLDLRGVAALERIRNAGEIGNGTASAIAGGYLEAGYHALPDGWKTGRLARSDLVAFVRREWIDTQNDLPSGAVRDDAGVRTEWTAGLTFFFTPGFVGKFDVQFRDDETTRDLATLVNFGVGWIF